jgi:hypothetical protein
MLAEFARVNSNWSSKTSIRATWSREIVDRFVDLHPDVPLTLRVEAEAIGL